MRKNFNNSAFKIIIQVFIICLFLQLLLGCTHSKQEDENKKEKVYTIDVGAIIDQKDSLSLSEIATDITYIPLETNKDNYFTGDYFQMTESYILVQSSVILVFNHQGKFIRKIGAVGHGPGEMTGLMGFVVNEQTNTVYIHGEYKFLQYDTLGNFIADKTTLKRNAVPTGGAFFLYGSSKYAFYSRSFDRQPINLVITDQNLKPIHKFINHKAKPRSSFGMVSTSIYVLEDKLYFKDQFNDTIFEVRDSLLIPHFILKEKELELEQTIEQGFQVMFGEIKNDELVSFPYIQESRRYLFLTYMKGCYSNKERKIRILFDKENEVSLTHVGNVVNDIDGGVNPWQNQMKINVDNSIVYLVNAFEIKDHVASEEFKNSTPKYPEKKKELEKLANSLSENDNPVLMVVKLKE